MVDATRDGIATATVTPWLAAKALGHSAAGHTQESRLDRALGDFFRRVLTPFLDPQSGGRARAMLWGVWATLRCP